MSVCKIENKVTAGGVAQDPVLGGESPGITVWAWTALAERVVHTPSMGGRVGKVIIGTGGFPWVELVSQSGLRRPSVGGFAGYGPGGYALIALTSLLIDELNIILGKLETHNQLLTRFTVRPTMTVDSYSKLGKQVFGVIQEVVFNKF